ncbi:MULTISPECIES: NusG domain II-containing protein [Niveibacterium]|uniref:NusG domain II-containing protein n=1 Tax=Niveibacterium microcysteis TaxID=2811415 RepID=A0ABX7M8J6_9RHOO|nr:MULTISPECIES: NusG domain II-containing protein [Niveibacterium]QSI76795.1 NusG domain II-containing protein [Niveibacterium microcysteis]
MRLAARDWLALIRPGDYLVLLLAAVLVGMLGRHFWRGGEADRAEIRAAGKLFATVPLSAPQVITVPGPLGLTKIEVDIGRARVASDPGPRQYCVRQGWLSTAGAVAICAPNEVTLALLARQPAYDSLGY